MSIVVVCRTCKKTVHAKDEFAGKKGKCPGCRGVLEIPKVAAATNAPEPTAMQEPKLPVSSSPGPDNIFAFLEEDPPATPKVQDAPPRRKPKNKHSPSLSSGSSERTWWIVGGIGAFGAECLLALVVGIVAMVGLSRRSTRETQQVQVQSSTQLGSGQTDVHSQEPVGNRIPAPAPPKPLENPPIVPVVNPPPKQPEKAADPDFRLTLVMYGNARFDHTDFRAKNFTGMLIEVEGMREGVLGKFDAAGVSVQMKEGLGVPATAIFIVGDRGGLVPTAQIQAGSVGKAGDIQIGNTRFPCEAIALGMRARANRASVNFNKGQSFTTRGDGAIVDASTPTATTGRVRTAPNENSYTVGDFLMAMPMILKEGGGVEFGFLRGKTVRLGFLFETEETTLSQLKVLGRSLEVDPQRRIAEAVETKGSPNFPPIQPPKQPLEEPPGKGSPKAIAKADIYLYKPKNKEGLPSVRVKVYQEDNGQMNTSVLDNSGRIGFAEISPGVMSLGVLIPGSTEIHVKVNRKLGYTTAANLRFLDDAIIDLLEDGMVEVNKVGVRAKTSNGTLYVSQEVVVDNRTTIVLARTKDK